MAAEKILSMKRRNKTGIKFLLFERWKTIYNAGEDPQCYSHFNYIIISRDDTRLGWNSFYGLINIRGI